MISMKELNSKGYIPTPIQEYNLEVLLDRLNKVRVQWDKPMTVTSGLRSVDDQKRIYAQMAKRKGTDVIRVPMGSRHLTGQAADIADSDGSLMVWCRANIPFLEQTQLWCEDGTVGWVHFQTAAPGSGNRFFKP